MPEKTDKPIVFTLTARCRDCYRCLRSCPVKAIRMQKGQAYVDEKRCIACGTCIRVCPQKAKTFRYDIDIAQSLIDNGHFVAASIAPSFAAVFNSWQRVRLASALRALGFRYIGQTSRGAYQVSAHTAKVIGKDDHAGNAGRAGRSVAAGEAAPTYPPIPLPSQGRGRQTPHAPLPLAWQSLP